MFVRYSKSWIICFYEEKNVFYFRYILKNVKLIMWWFRPSLVSIDLVLSEEKLFEKVYDGRKVMAIAHLTLWVRWAKDRLIKMDVIKHWCLNDLYINWYLLQYDENTRRPLIISKIWRGKNDQHIKIYLPCNFEVNLITHLGVIALFSSNL
jgi:hypothetical protein